MSRTGALGSGGGVTGLMALEGGGCYHDAWEKEVVLGVGLALDFRGVGANHDPITVIFPELLSVSEPISSPCGGASPCAEGNPQSPKKERSTGRESKLIG